MGILALNRVIAKESGAESALATAYGWLAGAVLGSACGAASLFLRYVKRSRFLWMLSARKYPKALDRFARFFAILTCRLARRTVPAYAKLLESAAPGRRFRRLSDFPETSKDNFAKVYPLASQCRHGRVHLAGATVDESSGSTGVPYNWLRSSVEQTDAHQNIANYIAMMFPDENLFCINAFSMGAWGTGVNFTMAMHKKWLVKSVGPDIETIISTLKIFGPHFDYLITGYPPLLKNLCDELDAADFPIGDYRLHALVGGEAITEALRDYLGRRFKKVVSGYGASDVQLAIGGETDFTVSLRKAIGCDRALRYALLGEGEDRVPMIFQYNPLDVFIEVNDASELLFTATNAGSMCPKPRYNLRDEGKVLSFTDTAAILRRAARETVAFDMRQRGLLKLPLIFLFGRSDSTISVMGANIYPQDVEYGLYANAELAGHIHSFFLSLEERADLRSMPTVNVELRAGFEAGAEFGLRFERELSHAITASLERINRDFANARREDPQTTMVQVHAFAQGAGPFTARRGCIKNRYVVRTPANA